MSAKDERVRRAIEAARILRASTAREAAEMTMGRPLTDSEWQEYGPVWQHAWDNPPGGVRI